MTTTWEAEAARMQQLFAQMHECSANLSHMAPDELDAADLRTFRKLRRQFARLHADVGEFAEGQRKGGGEITTMSGGT